MILPTHSLNAVVFAGTRGPIPDAAFARRRDAARRRVVIRCDRKAHSTRRTCDRIREAVKSGAVCLPEDHGVELREDTASES